MNAFALVIYLIKDIIGHMEWMVTNSVGREVFIAVLGAAAVGAATLTWNWASAGGVVRALGGATVADVQTLIDKSKAPIDTGPPLQVENLISFRVTNGPIQTATSIGGNAGASAKCDKGIVVGGSCRLVQGRGLLYNSGVDADGIGCTWGDTTDRAFVGHVQATCLQIEKK